LGATQERLARQLLTESLLLFFFGGLGGTLVGLWGMKLIESWIPGRIRGYMINYGHVDLDFVTLPFTLGIAIEGARRVRFSGCSTHQNVNLLLAMRDDPAGDEFIQDLALTGKEGTVADRMHGTAAYGRCRTKTGTITGVSNLSGYCFNKSGRIMAFSILMNGVGDVGYAHLQQDRIAGAVAGY